MILVGLLCSLLTVAPVSVSAQYGPIPVIDVNAVIQWVIQLERMLKEIELLTKQFDDMTRNSAKVKGVWEQAFPLLDRLGRNIEQARALAYTLKQLDAVFRQRYPGFVPPRDWAAEYDGWVGTVLDTLRGTLTSVQMQSEEFLDEDQRLQAITAKSETAIGRMQAIQAGNMIAAENTRHLMKLRQLMMMQLDAQNTWMAKETNQEAQIDAFTRQWLLNAKKPLPAELQTKLQRALNARTGQ